MSEVVEAVMMQHKLRAAFEEGWRAAGGDPVQSPWNQEPRGWRAAWIKSETRQWLVAAGILSGEETWR